MIVFLGGGGWYARVSQVNKLGYKRDTKSRLFGTVGGNLCLKIREKDLVGLTTAIERRKAAKDKVKDKMNQRSDWK